jgi:hypothetical protein
MKKRQFVVSWVAVSAEIGEWASWKLLRADAVCPGILNHMFRACQRFRRLVTAGMDHRKGGSRMSELSLSVKRNKDRSLCFSATYQGQTAKVDDWDPKIDDSSDVYEGLKEAFAVKGLKPDADFRTEFKTKFDALEDQYHGPSIERFLRLE